MLRRLTGFARDQRGAVTVDWVVLTASLVGLAIGVVLTIRGTLDMTVSDIDTALSNTPLLDTGNLTLP